MSALGRAEYAARYGPTAGDRVRIADTDLWVEVEADDVAPGDELIGGCGKTARDGVLVAARVSGRDSALDKKVSPLSDMHADRRPELYGRVAH